MSQGSTQLSAAQRRQSQMKRSLRTVLEQGKERFRSVLPKHVTPDRMINIALTAATLNPKLLDCTPESVGLALLTASQTGLEPDGYHAHLIPYKRHCQFVPDYKGLIQLALKNDVVIDAYAVYENDEFDYQLGSDPRVIHKPAIDDDRGKLRCAYAVAHFKNGTKKFVVATRKEVEKRRKASASSDKPDSPWNEWEDEMWQKCAVKMLMKYVPRNPELTYATSADDMAEMGLQQQPMVSPGQLPRQLPESRQSRSEEALGILGDQEQGESEPESGEAISNPDNVVKVFSEAVEPLESEEEVKQLFATMVEANKGELTPQALADAEEARDVKIAIIKGEITAE